MDRVNLEDAMMFAYYAHFGQYRKCSPKKTNLYVSHPLSVMELVKRFGGTKEDMIVACLHDVLEDCKEKGYTYSILESKFGKKVADRVYNLTNKKIDSKTGKKLSNEEWKLRKKELQIAAVKKMSPEDQLIKACDQIHNMSDYKEYSVGNVHYREEYVDKAYEVIKACGRNVPLDLRVYARTMYKEAKGFFNKQKLPVKEVPKYTQLFSQEIITSPQRQYAKI